jgi:hypothetical protein
MRTVCDQTVSEAPRAVSQAAVAITEAHQSRALVGAGAGQVGEYGAEVAVPSGHLGVVGTVGGRVDVQPPSCLWLCDSEGPGS